MERSIELTKKLLILCSAGPIKKKFGLKGPNSLGEQGACARELYAKGMMM